MVTERDYLQRVRDTARLFGWRTYHTHDSRRSEPGFPDLVLIRDHRMIVAELKTEAGRVTPAQAEWIRALTQVTGPPEVHVWRPSTWPQVLYQLRRDS